MEIMFCIVKELQKIVGSTIYLVRIKNPAEDELDHSKMILYKCRLRLVVLRYMYFVN